MAQLRETLTLISAEHTLDREASSLAGRRISAGLRGAGPGAARSSIANDTAGAIPACPSPARTSRLWVKRLLCPTLVGMARLRRLSGRSTDVPRPSHTLIAELSDGPLAGSTRHVTAVEGRPPKTVDLEFGDRRVRYCLIEWEQSGHSAVYGFLYEL